MATRVPVPFLFFITVLHLAMMHGVSANNLTSPLDDPDIIEARKIVQKHLDFHLENFLSLTVTIDYRHSRCMPPIKEHFTIYNALRNFYRVCFCPASFIMPVVMAEYIDCQSSWRHTLSNFSVQQVIDCLYDVPTLCYNFNNQENYDQVDSLQYLLSSGVALASDYDKAVVQYGLPNFGPEYGCARKYVPVAFNLTRGYKTLHQFDENYMAKVVTFSGPILADLHFSREQIIKMIQIIYWGSSVANGFVDYKAGILDHRTLCAPSVRDSAYSQNDVGSYSLLFAKGFQVPVMIVGFTTYEGVPVWIVRCDWFGKNWGINGHFYLRRGVNACNVGLNPIRVLG